VDPFRFLIEGETMKALGLMSFVLTVMAAVSAHAGDEAAEKKDKAALQGLWKIVSIEFFQGKDENAVGVIFDFDKDGKKLTIDPNGKTKKATFTLNPAGKPKEIELKTTDDDRSYEGIYEITKGSLKLCFALNAGDGRPTEFATKEGKSYVLATLEKAK
jgi:uncharacterized protein (TIGR03067 family)